MERVKERRGGRAAWREGSMSKSIVDAGDVKKKKKRN